MTKKPCQDHERRWRDFCVDRNLEDAWLERLNALRTLNLINVCEGHRPQQRRDPAGPAGSRFAHIHLRLKTHLLSKVAQNWEAQKIALLHDINERFQIGDTMVEIELKFKLRLGVGRLTYREDLTVRIRSRLARKSESLDPATRLWFERNIERLEALDTRLGQLLPEVSPTPPESTAPPKDK